MKISFSESAEKDIAYWEKTDPKKKARIKQLIRQILETPHHGISKP